MFDDLVKQACEGPVSKEEMVQIKKALGGNVTKWYTCSKGGREHYYKFIKKDNSTEKIIFLYCKACVKILMLIYFI
jgi:hypothetical protein